MPHTILVDGNNLGFAGMSMPRLTSGERDTQSIFSVIKRIRDIFAYNPTSNIIVLWDGRSWRKDFYKEYKANRETTEKAIEARKEYYIQKEQIIRGLELLGVRQVWGTNQEADDMAAMLSKSLSMKGEQVTLMTADKDWQQLVDKNVSWLDIIHAKSCNLKNFNEVTGFENSELFIEAKCILGDPSDNIKGINGIGPKALEGIYSAYDSFGDFLHHLEVDRAHAVSEWLLAKGKTMPKALRELDIEAARNKLSDNKVLVDLHTVVKPKIDKIVDKRGKFDIKEFEEFCYEHAFLSITKNIKTFIKPIQESKYVNK